MKKTAIWICMATGVLLCSACTVPGKKSPVTETPVPSAEPTQVVTVSPLPSKTPTPGLTESPITASPSVSPGLEGKEPTKAPLVNQMIGNGWQRADDLNECCKIVFPEIFRTGMTGGTKEDMLFQYSSEEEPQLRFTIRYLTEKSYEEVKAELSGAQTREEAFFGADRNLYYTKDDGIYIYKGRIIEHNSEEATETAPDVRVVVVEFRYPKEEREKYETEQFRYDIVRRQ